MGYYTYYDLSVVNEDKFSKEELIKAAKALANITDIIDEKDISEDYPFSWISDESMKWYDYDSDMTELSGLFPEMKFKLYGEGEERDDNWIAYYYNGEGTICQGHLYFDDPPEWIYED